MAAAPPTVVPRSNLKHNPLYIDLPTNVEYTSDDRIVGTIRVDPTLRPSRINVSFKGYSVFHDGSATGVRVSFFDFSNDIFISAGAHENFDILRRGTANDGKVELPFDFTFPTTAVLGPPSERNWHYHKDSYDHPRFQHFPGFLLPPNLPLDLVSSSPTAPKIIYSIEVCMDSTVPRMKVHQELKFVPLAPEYDLNLSRPLLEFGTTLPKHCCRYKFIRTRKLLPGYEGSSRLGKFKDLLVEKELFFGLESFAEVPYVKFNVLATPARVLVMGAPVPVIITVQHLDRSASVPDPPDLFLRRIRVQILSAVHIFVPRILNTKGAGKENAEILRDALTLFDRKFDEGSGRPLHDGLNLTELGDIKLTHPKLLPSFTSYGIAVEYEIQVEIFGECATHEFSGIICRDQIQIAPKWTARPPPMHASQEFVSAEAGPAYQEVESVTPPTTTAPQNGSSRLPMPPRYPSEPSPHAYALQSGSGVPQASWQQMPPPYMAL